MSDLIDQPKGPEYPKPKCRKGVAGQGSEWPCDLVRHGEDEPCMSMSIGASIRQRQEWELKHPDKAQLEDIVPQAVVGDRDIDWQPLIDDVHFHRGRKHTHTGGREDHGHGLRHDLIRTPPVMPENPEPGRNLLLDLPDPEPESALIQDQPLPVHNEAPDMQSQVIADIEKRRRHGIEKYGTALQPFNHRDGMRDAYEEALDLVTYLAQVREEYRRGIDIVNQCFDIVQDGRSTWQEEMAVKLDRLRDIFI